jgi:hypothetical protein
MPVEVSRIVGGTPLRPALHEHGSSTQPVDAHTCSMRDCAVVKAMETIEVLEHILTFVPSRQIVLLQMVNKTWRLLINNSPQLYPHLFIEPRWRHPAKAFRLLHLTTMPGLSIKRGDSVHLGQWVEARMSLAAAQKIADLKSNDANFQNTADLLITQPPLRAISAFVYGSKKTPKAHSKMFCDAGITLDFMADVAQVVLKNNKHGDNAESVFKAIISFGVQSDAAPRMRSTTRTVTKVT